MVRAWEEELSGSRMWWYAGLKLKILVVDIHSSNVLQPVKLRAELGWTVGMLKNEIGKVTRMYLYYYAFSNFLFSHDNYI